MVEKTTLTNTSIEKEFILFKNQGKLLYFLFTGYIIGM